MTLVTFKLPAELGGDLHYEMDEIVAGRLWRAVTEGGTLQKAIQFTDALGQRVFMLPVWTVVEMVEITETTGAR